MKHTGSNAKMTEECPKKTVIHRDFWRITDQSVISSVLLGRSAPPFFGNPVNAATIDTVSTHSFPNTQKASRFLRKYNPKNSTINKIIKGIQSS